MSSCQNVEVANVKKTNGYEKDGDYRVEYSYTLRLKNADDLAKLKKAWLVEKERAAEFIPARDAHESHIRDIEAEIDRIGATFEDKRPDVKQFSTSARAFYDLADHERRAYDAAQNEWLSAKTAATEAKRKELDEAKQAWNEDRAKVPQATVYGSEGNVVYNFLSRSCSRAGWNYASGLFDAYSEAVGQANANNPPGAARDASLWLDERTAKMTGTMTMHKTENGWKALSESM